MFLASIAASTSLMRAPIGMILAAPGGKDFLLAFSTNPRAVATVEGYRPARLRWNARQGLPRKARRSPHRCSATLRRANRSKPIM